MNEKKTIKALLWIAKILNNNNIPYKIGGGLAVSIYGSKREVNDIDISLSGKYFPIIVPLVKEFIISEPKHYLNEKWDCTTLSLNYYGQEIDLTDVNTLLMKDNKKWIKNKEIYEKYPSVTKKINGIQVTLMHPKVLLEYKKHLDGDHQKSDRKFLSEYIAKNNF